MNADNFSVVNVVRDIPRDDCVAIVGLLNLDILLALKHTSFTTFVFNGNLVVLIKSAIQD